MCKVLFLVLAALALRHGLPVESEGQWDSRVVGGSIVLERDAPYMVSVRHISNLHLCGGTIITPRTILTSALCAYGISPNYTMVIAGTNFLNVGGTKYNINKVIVHENFELDRMVNDIGLIILLSPIEMNTNVQPITLSQTETGADVLVNMTGWGTVSYPGSTPTSLLTVNLKTITNEACNKVLPGAYPVLKTNICTLTKKDEGVCHGDQGGPLVDINYGAQVGIVSWFEKCALGFPDVYTRVSSYISWINENKLD